MNRDSRGTNCGISELRFLITAACAAAALVFATQAVAALTNIGPGQFSGAATTLTFEDLPGNGSTLPAGYGSASGVTFSATTTSQLYSNYGGTLAAAATTAGLGSVAATWGGNGSYGTGFSLTSPQMRVGFYISSNVTITNVPISAYKSGVLLGSQTFSVAANQIAFVGFEDPSGIDQIVIGNNAACTGCVHQLDNLKFETAASAAIPTMSRSGMIILASLLALGTAFALRRRHQ